MMIIIFLMLIDGCLVAAPIRSEQSRPLVQLLEEETNDSEFLGWLACQKQLKYHGV